LSNSVRSKVLAYILLEARAISHIAWLEASICEYEGFIAWAICLSSRGYISISPGY